MTTDITNHRVVAVDGGAATGKGRLVEELAGLLRSKGLPVLHLSTGSLYRAVAWAALQSVRARIPNASDLSMADYNREALELVRGLEPEALVAAARDHQLAMHNGVVWLDGKPASVEEQLKGPSLGVGSSLMGGHLLVREMAGEITRRQINEFDGYVLVDGRDIGSMVVPDAPLKLFLTVAPHIAAQRSPEHTAEEIMARDEADRQHKHGALPRLEDLHETVVVLPTDDHTPESVRDHVYGLMCEAFPELPSL